MGATMSVLGLGECMGDYSRTPYRSPHSAPTVAPSLAPSGHAKPSPSAPPPASQKAPCKAAAASQGAAVAALPPPLVPTAHAVYDLCAGEEEDVCPTCLECYGEENPRIVPECGHAAHLQCILVWNERSGSRWCPVCAKPLVFEGAGALLAT